MVTTTTAKETEKVEESKQEGEVLKKKELGSAL